MDPGITDGQHTRLYDTNALQRVLDTMAAGVSARLAGAEQVSLVGVLRRGAPLADMLQERLVQRLPRTDMQRIDLSIKRYSDDLKLLHPQTQLIEQPEHTNMDLSGRVVVLVDDVLYGGFSLNRAVQYLVAKQVKTIHTVVLVDRVCATLPIHADVSGMKLQVEPGSIVECHVPPYESTFQIVLVRPSAQAQG
ncbi:MAG TPA: phosphoribosyltransferase family protein [Burkholderiaceae bacterium]|nr:phosphoribosyltransferase family protein [Burkholderiaceae bacterium]